MSRPQTCSSEEGSNQVRLLADASYGQMVLKVQFFQVQTNQVTHLNMFELLPESFVRIEIRCIGRQSLQMDSVCPVLRQELPDIRTSVDWRSVPNHHQPAGCLSQQMLQELYAVQTRQRGLTGQGVQFPLWRNPTHHGKMISALPFLQDRPSALGAKIGRAHV